MGEMDKERVFEMVEKHNVKFIRLWFTDILGYLKSFAITVQELEDALEDGAGFDGSSIEGFARIDESDMVAVPDPSTFQILPWNTNERSTVARMFCDILEPDGKSYEGDPRRVLKNMLEKAADMGYTFYVGPELEYFYFKNDSGTPVPLDKGGYFDLIPSDVSSDLRRETVLTLEQMGVGIECSHHEVAPSQHELAMRYTDALTMADSVMTYRLVVKEIALMHHVYATFMPKPMFGENGSGMHVHQSLFKGDKNAFFDRDDKYHLSDVAKCYIAGLLHYAQEITLITNQWVNSYKRLVPGYEAPVYVSWARRNRSDLIRVPVYKPGHEKSTRIEYRSPDPACNPYLAFAVMLAAGLEGIKNGYELRESVDRDVYKMTEKEREREGIAILPESLFEAIRLAENSDLLRKTLDDHIFFSLIENKKIEWERYRIQITNYELEEYLPML